MWGLVVTAWTKRVVFFFFVFLHVRATVCLVEFWLCVGLRFCLGVILFLSELWDSVRILFMNFATGSWALKGKGRRVMKTENKIQLLYKCCIR